MNAQSRRESAAAAAFNAAHRVGTRVAVYPGTRDGRRIETVTRSEAQVLSGHTAVVWVAGVAGCIALGHVDVLP